MLRRAAEPALFFLFGLCAFVLVEAALSFHSTHCENQSPQTQTPNSIQRNAPSSDQHSDDRRANKEQNNNPAHRIVCGITGLYGLVSLMDSHEGFFVGLFTCFLFIATLLLWRATGDLWQATTNAIKTTENTTLAVEGAYVFAGIGGSGLVTVAAVSEDGIQLPQTVDRFVRLSASAVNYGRTAGLISDIEWDICRESRLPPIGTKLTYRGRIHVGWTIPPKRAMELRQTILEVRRINWPHVFYGRIAFD